MLAINDKDAFLNIFKPPPGYSFSGCIGTTYSLELDCLMQLAINAGMASLGGDNISGAECLALVEEFEKKAIIFVQNCRIKQLGEGVGRHQEKLKFYKYLDGIIKSVPTLGSDSSFHPKVWICRYVPDKKTDKVKYSLAVMSRNLSSDLSWDVGAVLSGSYEQSGKKGQNQELLQFLRRLFSTNGTLTNKQSKLAELITRELASVEFDAPKGVKKAEFLYKWGNEKKWRLFEPENYSKLIAVSPFLSVKMLKTLEKCENRILITSESDIEKVANVDGIKHDSFLFSMEPIGLHAKLYCGLTKGTDKVTEIVVGSANFTSNAFNGNNVEAVLKLEMAEGQFKEFAMNFVFKDEKKVEMHNWLKRYSENMCIKEDDEREKLKAKKMLDQGRNIISQGQFTVHHNGKQQCKITYKGPTEIPDGIQGTIRIMGCNEPSISLGTLLLGKDWVFDLEFADVTTLLDIELRFLNETENFCVSATGVFDADLRSRKVFSSEINTIDELLACLAASLHIKSNGYARMAPRNAANNHGHSGSGVAIYNVELLEHLMLAADGYDSTEMEKIEQRMKDFALKPGVDAQSLGRFLTDQWPAFLEAHKECFSNGKK